MITLKLEPTLFQSAYNEIITVITSDKITEPKFEYVVKILVDDEFKSEINVYNNIEGYGIFDIHKHIEPFVGSDVQQIESTKTFDRSENSMKKYSIELMESYVVTQEYTSVAFDAGYVRLMFDNVVWEVGDEIRILSDNGRYYGNATITTVYSDSVTVDIIYTGDSTGTFTRVDGGVSRFPSDVVYSENKYAVNSALDIFDSFYYPNREFITTLPEFTDVYEGDSYRINYITDGLNNGTDYLRVATARGVFLVENPYTYFNAVMPGVPTMYSVGVGMYDLERSNNNIIVKEGSLPMFDDTTKSYLVALTDASQSGDGCRFNFKIKDSCSKFENFKLVYLDKFGSFSTFNFNLASTKTVTAKKSNYLKNTGTYDPVANTYGSNRYERGITRLDTEINDIYTITTDWVSEEEGKRVIELMESPEVYRLEGNAVVGTSNKLVAINVTTSSLVEKQKVKKKLFNYTISFEDNHKRSVQKG